MVNARRGIIALALQFALAASAFAIDLRELDGVWWGMYTYADPAKRPVEFSMDIRVAGNACQGRIEEPNTFGLPSVPRLYANTDCRLLIGGGPTRLMFRKTYDGTGGQSHSVDYEGEIASDNRGITGVWRIGTQLGRFSLIKR
jgi:hypothetical protein